MAADRPRFPGALPAVFTVPFAASPWFTGRAGALAAIRGRLAGAGSGHVVPVTGIGGVGKTQLVVEYAYAERGSYDVVWWVRAQPLAMARADLAGLVADPRLPDPPQLSAQVSVEDRLAAARDWLERHDRCLLIVDNVDDPAAVRPLLPRAGGGHVLLTARSDVDWAGWATSLPLDMLEADDAARFLRDRSGDSDEAAAAALATELGRLPLALEQAAGVHRRDRRPDPGRLPGPVPHPQPRTARPWPPGRPGQHRQYHLVAVARSADPGVPASG